MNLKLLLLLILLSISSVNVTQDEGWPIEQRCLGDLPYPTIPQNEWTFEGVIFSRNRDGVRAIRTDVDTSYFIALDSYRSFAFNGSFSPDGKWFAYPTGDTQFSNITSNLISVDNVQVVSTNPARKIYKFPWRSIGFSGITRGLPVSYWLDNEHFLYASFLYVDAMQGEGGIVNAFNGGYEPWSNEVTLFELHNFSPDLTRAFHWDRKGVGLTRLTSLYDVENDRILTSFEYGHSGAVWIPDSSGFIANVTRSDQITTVALFDRNGQIVETISDDLLIGNPAFARDGQRFAFVTWRNMNMGNLYMGDMQERVITDLCFKIDGEGQLSWSPDDIHFVFTYDGYPIILNTDTLEMQILRYKTGEILGWYALEDG